jgi:hypothetical protein
LLLLALSEIENKQQDHGQHDGPICIYESNGHGLMDTNDDKYNSERKNQDVNKLHNDKGTHFEKRETCLKMQIRDAGFWPQTSIQDPASSLSKIGIQALNTAAFH